MARAVLELDALLKVPYVRAEEGFHFSPDGKQVAYSWNNSGVWEIYILSLSQGAEALQITAGPGAKVGPRWSPDGARLAYALDADGGELWDIYICEVATGKHINLTPNSAYAISPLLSWSPDGLRIAFTCDRSGHFDTYVKEVGGGEARLILGSEFPEREAHWSPDGRWLAVVAEAEGQNFATFIVPSEGGMPRAIALPSTGSRKPAMLSARDARWSPDGARLAFASDHLGEYQIGIFTLQSGEISWVTQGEGRKERPAWSPDGRWLAFQYGEGPTSSVGVLDVATGKTRKFAVGKGVHERPIFSPDGAHLGVVFESPNLAPDLWLISMQDRAFTQLTHSMPDTLAGTEYVCPVEVRYPSRDGRQVPALLYRPGGEKAPEVGAPDELPPAVISVHGGPNWYSQMWWDPLIQHMVSRGWVVLAPNYRGSIGYGREWQLANRYDLGGGDAEDVVAGAEFLAREKLADAQRLAITGTSYGGYLTMVCLTRFPEFWAAGSAIVPFLNWFTSHLNSREDLQHWDLENFGDPVEDFDRWHERSPFFYLERVQAPVQLICGAHDPRCPASESTRAHDVLQRLGKKVDLVLYKDEGHSFLKTGTRIDSKSRCVAFLAEALEKGFSSLPQPDRGSEEDED
jgi:dipeptidyl aminopeptidase/acylaminoacyl peptidase